MRHRLAETTAPLRAAVVGYGQFGQLHAAKYQALAGAVLAGVVETDAKRRALAQREYPAIPVFAGVEDLLAAAPPDIASVVVPATQHHGVARSLLEAGVHVLVEKPLASDPDDAGELVQLAARSNLTILPGHLERFHPVFTELRAKIPAPQLIAARRLTRWTGRGADVDAVLDLMIHDIDLVLELVASPLVNIRASGAKVVTDHWDVADAELLFANGCVAKLTASRASDHAERRLHLFSENAFALVSGGNGTVRLYQTGKSGTLSNTWFYRNADPLAAEIADFVGAVRGRRPLAVSASDGCRAVTIARDIAAAIECGQGPAAAKLTTISAPVAR